MDDGNAGSKNANTSNKSNNTQYVVAEFVRTPYRRRRFGVRGIDGEDLSSTVIISDNNGRGHDGVDIRYCYD
jgi:hypothetical protein